MASLLEDKHLGVVTSCVALLLGFATASPTDYTVLVPYVVLLLTRLTVHKACQRNYLYYDTPNPWLQVQYNNCYSEISMIQ
jgi:AP-2 complex subunit alpha